jgi:hypothetical protein
MWLPFRGVRLPHEGRVLVKWWHRVLRTATPWRIRDAANQRGFDVPEQILTRNFQMPLAAVAWPPRESVSRERRPENEKNTRFGGLWTACRHNLFNHCELRRLPKAAKPVFLAVFESNLTVYDGDEICVTDCPERDYSECTKAANQLHRPPNDPAVGVLWRRL